MRNLYPRQQPQIPQFDRKPEYHQCFKCNYETVTAQPFCPRCHKSQFFTQSEIRGRGVVVIMCSLIVLGVMGGVILLIGLLSSGAIKGIHRVESSAGVDEIWLVISIFFALIMALGLNFMFLGGWMVVFGRGNRILFKLMWVLLLLIGIGMAVIRYLI